MKTAVKPDFKAKTFCSSKSYNLFCEKQKCLVNIKFYQKFFLILISLCTFLIFPESPSELENICESYNPINSCNVW